MTVEQRLERALGSPQPVLALRAVVLELAKESHSKAQIYDLLETFLIKLRSNDTCQESDENAILEVMDALTGWCHPDYQLLPDHKS